MYKSEAGASLTISPPYEGLLSRECGPFTTRFREIFAILTAIWKYMRMEKSICCHCCALLIWTMLNTDEM
jgi:hypothetical protein